MIENFNLTSSPNIVFGCGSINKLASILPNDCKNIALITGNKSFTESDFSKTVLTQLGNYAIERCSVSSEPSPAMIDDIVIQTKKKVVDCVIGIGGGSVLDAAKAISAMLKEEGSVKEYLEGVGTKQPSGKKLPLIAIPTTSGTGSEMTKNAVISELGSQGFKKSLRHNNYIPDVAIVDPELTISCTPEVTAATGMDAFTQLLESYLSTGRNPMTDALALSGLERIALSLETAVKQGDNIEARTNLSYASMVSGITLANAGLGLSHGFAQPLGSLFPISHGVVCAQLMGVVNRKTVQKLMSTNDGSFLKKYEIVAKLFVEDHKASPMNIINQFLDIIDDYVKEFNIPKLSKFGVKSSDFDVILAQTGHKNHPVKFEENELKQILFDCM